MVSLLLVGCQSAANSPEQIANYRQIEYFLLSRSLEVKGSATGVRESAIRDWGRVNDQAVILAVAPDDLVLVTLTEPCENLAKARAIGFERGLSYVVMDPMGQGFDINERFSEYLSPRDNLILGLSDEEVEEVKMQQMGPMPDQLGACRVGQVLYLEEIVRQQPEEQEV